MNFSSVYSIKSEIVYNEKRESLKSNFGKIYIATRTILDTYKDSLDELTPLLYYNPLLK